MAAGDEQVVFGIAFASPFDTDAVLGFGFYDVCQFLSAGLAAHRLATAVAIEHFASFAGGWPAVC